MMKRILILCLLAITILGAQVYKGWDGSDFRILDDKFLIVGTDRDVYIGYDEATNNALEIRQNIDGSALTIIWKADRGDDAGDELKWNLADGGILTYGSDIASAGTYITHLTLTPHATLTSAVLAFVGDVDVGDDLLMSDLGVINWNSGDVTMTHSSNSLTFAGGDISLQDATPYDLINDNSTTGVDANSGHLILRGNDGAADTELQMSVVLEVNTTTDYYWAWYNDNKGTEVGSIDQDGNLQLDGVISAPYTQVASTGDATESITHSLGYRPFVWVYSTDDEKNMDAEVDHTDENTFVVTTAYTLNFTINYR